MARDRRHQGPTYSAAARIRPNVEIAEPQTLPGGMRLKALANDRIDHQSARNLRHQAIEPSLRTASVS
jgi:hypothetical protein